MYEILLSVCVAAQPASCETVRLALLQEQATSIGCMLSAQSEIGMWLEDHPDKVIQRWSCVRAASQ